MDRRQFVKNTSTACMGGLIGAGLLSGCSGLYYATYTMENKRIKVSRSEFVDRDFVLIKNDSLPAPIYLRKQGEVFTALLLLCTHRNCEVAPFGAELHCPCHGSEFSNSGDVLTGPAEDPLKKLKTESDEQFIYIS